MGYIAGVLTGQLKKSIPPETPKFTISTKCYSGGVMIYEHKGGYVSTGSLEALAIKDGDRKTLITLKLSGRRAVSAVLVDPLVGRFY